MRGGPWRGEGRTLEGWGASRCPPGSPCCLGAIQLNSHPQAQAQGSKHCGRFGGSAPTLQGGFPTRGCPPGTRPCTAAEGGRWVERNQLGVRAEPGSLARGNGVSPSLLPRVGAWCWTVCLPQALLTAAMLRPHTPVAGTWQRGFPGTLTPGRVRGVVGARGPAQEGHPGSGKPPGPALLAAGEGLAGRWGPLSLAGSEPRVMRRGLGWLPPESPLARAPHPSLQPHGGRAGQGERRKPERASFPFKSPDGRRPDPAAQPGGGKTWGRRPPELPESLFRGGRRARPGAPPPGRSPAPRLARARPRRPCRCPARGRESERHLPGRPGPRARRWQRSQVHVRPAGSLRSGGRPGQARPGHEGSPPGSPPRPAPLGRAAPRSPRPRDPNFPHSRGAGSFRASRALGRVSAATSELGNKEGAGWERGAEEGRRWSQGGRSGVPRTGNSTQKLWDLAFLKGQTTAPLGPGRPRALPLAEARSSGTCPSYSPHGSAWAVPGGSREGGHKMLPERRLVLRADPRLGWQAPDFLWSHPLGTGVMTLGFCSRARDSGSPSVQVLGTSQGDLSGGRVQGRDCEGASSSGTGAEGLRAARRPWEAPHWPAGVLV